jgi:hypothetical protein
MEHFLETEDGTSGRPAAIRQAAASNLMFGQSLVLSNFGRVCHLAGRDDEALTHAHDAIDVARASGERGNEAWAWCLLGDLVSDGNASAPRIEEAHSHYCMALRIAQDLGMRPFQAQCLNGLSRLQKMVGDEALAEQHAADAMSLCREMGMKPLAV